MKIFAGLKEWGGMESSEENRLVNLMVRRSRMELDVRPSMTFHP
jgi:hypothetical protein